MTPWNLLGVLSACLVTIGMLMDARSLCLLLNSVGFKSRQRLRASMSIPIVTRQADSTPRRFQGVTPGIPCPGIHRLHVTPRFPRISGALFQEIPKGVTPPVLCIL